jgi:hypothetical protein
MNTKPSTKLWINQYLLSFSFNAFLVGETSLNNEHNEDRSDSKLKLEYKGMNLVAIKNKIT